MNKPENRYFALTKTPAFHQAPSLSEAQNFAGEEGYVWLDILIRTAESRLSWKAGLASNSFLLRTA